MGTREQCAERQGKFVTSIDPENFTFWEIFHSKAAAIELGRKEGHSYVGVIDFPSILDSVDEDVVLEHITEQDEFAGDIWQGFLSDEVSTEMSLELRKALTNALGDWMDKHHLWPSQCNVVDIEPIPELDEASEGGDV